MGETSQEKCPMLPFGYLKSIGHQKQGWGLSPATLTKMPLVFFSWQNLYRVARQRRLLWWYQSVNLFQFGCGEFVFLWPFTLFRSQITRSQLQCMALSSSQGKAKGEKTNLSLTCEFAGADIIAPILLLKRRKLWCGEVLGFVLS